MPGAHHSHKQEEGKVNCSLTAAMAGQTHFLAGCGGKELLYVFPHTAFIEGCFPMVLDIYDDQESYYLILHMVNTF